MAIAGVRSTPAPEASRARPGCLRSLGSSHGWRRGVAYEGLDSPPPPRPHRPGGSPWVPIAFWLSILSFAVCGLTSPISFIIACAMGMRERRQGWRPHRVTYWTMSLSLAGTLLAFVLIGMQWFS